MIYGENTKSCTMCGTEFARTLEFFGVHSKRGHLSPRCRRCESEASGARYRANKERQLLQRRERYAAKKQEILRKQREYNRRPENKDRAKALKQGRRDELRAYMRKYLRERWRSETWVRFSGLIASAVRGSLAGRRRSIPQLERHCGYTVGDLRRHLERAFTPEMSWDNYGKVWEVDHIEPLAKFRVVTVESPDFKNAWGLQNLRPLLKSLNRKKSARVDLPI